MFIILIQAIMWFFAKLRSRDDKFFTVDIYNLLLAIWPILENKVLTKCQSSLPNKEYIHFALTAMGILQMAAESVNDLGLPTE